MRDKELIAYKRMPVWTKETMPDLVQKQHNTKAGTWGKIRIVRGSLCFYQLTEEGQVLSSHVWHAGEEVPFVEPQAWHKVEGLTEDLEWCLEFYCRPEDYFVKKYNSGAVHSEVLEAFPNLEVQTVLDLGCGQGRNSLYLAKQGLQVTAVDQNQLALAQLERIVEQEELEMEIATYDIHQAHLMGNYDWIISTVVLMFLQAECIPAIIRDMQEHTNPGGYNLIVCAMDTEDFPCSVNFPFTFKEGELADYYKDWELVKYNENPGHLHRRDEQGNRIQLRFATMLARKPKK